MKKTFNTILAALSVLFLAIACNKDIPHTPSNTPEEGTPSAAETVTVTASLSDVLTRVSFDPVYDNSSKPTGMSHTWEEGDKLRITDASNPSNTKLYDLVDGSGSANGVFRGEAVIADSYNVEAVPFGEFGTEAKQTQDSDGDTGHLQFVASATGVTDLTDIQLTETSRIIGIIAKLPAGAAAGIDELEIQTSADDFITSTTLTVQISTAGDTDNDDILKVYANVPANWVISAGTKMFLRFKAPNTSHTVYTRYQEFAAAVTPQEGKFNYIKMNCVNTDKWAGGSDNGTQAAPYLIADKYQMDAMHQLMERAQMKYFKLIDNIDMTGIVWFPLNNGFPESGGTKYTGNVYDKAIDFNGNGKEIKYLSTKQGSLGESDTYASIFGVLMGNVYDLTIDNATIYPKGKSGILAGFVGTGNYGPNHCEVRNVSIKNSTLADGGDFCGALAGQSAKNGNVFSQITISDCSVSTVGYAAGLVAYFANSASVSDITVSKTDIISSGHSTNATIPNDGLAGGISARVNAAVGFNRCTYRTGTILGPTVQDNDNSKLNRYVGGLVGRVDNKAASFDDCHVNDLTIGLTGEAPANNNSRYVGGAFGYLGAAVSIGNSTGCSVEGLATNDNVRNYVAGFVSFLDGATVKNSTATSESAIGNSQYSGAVGGFVGYCVGGTLYNNSASVNITGAGNPGGFVGWIETTAASIEKCSASGSVVAGANNAGGFCGIDKIGATFTECSSSGQVTSSAGYVGGLIGYINADGATIKNCFSTSTVTASGNYVGGLVGVAESDTIEESYYDGTVKGNSRVGGILGIGLKDDATTIKNCYSRGKVVGSPTEQRYGGIVGDLGKEGVVENCWSDAEITGGRVLGGIVGLACYQTWGDQTVANNTIKGCIAWNPKVIAAQAGNYGSSGAVIGHTSFKNVFDNGYRRPDMQYKNSYSCSGGEWNTTMVDQPNCDGTNWAKGTTPGTKAEYTYQQPYYGTAAASTATVSSIAQTLGWSGDVWDFSGALPQLKWAME